MRAGGSAYKAEKYLLVIEEERDKSKRIKGVSWGVKRFDRKNPVLPYMSGGKKLIASLSFKKPIREKRKKKEGYVRR